MCSLFLQRCVSPLTNIESGLTGEAPFMNVARRIQDICKKYSQATYADLPSLVDAHTRRASVGAWRERAVGGGTPRGGGLLVYGRRNLCEKVACYHYGRLRLVWEYDQQTEETLCS